MSFRQRGILKIYYHSTVAFVSKHNDWTLKWSFYRWRWWLNVWACLLFVFFSSFDSSESKTINQFPVNASNCTTAKSAPAMCGLFFLKADEFPCDSYKYGSCSNMSYFMRKLNIRAEISNSSRELNEWFRLPWADSSAVWKLFQWCSPEHLCCCDNVQYHVIIPTQTYISSSSVLFKSSFFITVTQLTQLVGNFKCNFKCVLVGYTNILNLKHSTKTQFYFKTDLFSIWCKLQSESSL